MLNQCATFSQRCGALDVALSSDARGDLEELDFRSSGRHCIQVELHHLRHLLMLDLTRAQLVQACRRLPFPARLACDAPQFNGHILFKAASDHQSWVLSAHPYLADGSLVAVPQGVLHLSTELKLLLVVSYLKYLHLDVIKAGDCHVEFDRLQPFFSERKSAFTRTFSETKGCGSNFSAAT